MYELLTLAAHPDWIDRVYPIMAAPDMFDDERALQAEVHWRKEYTRFDAMVRELDHLDGQRYAEGLRLRRRIADKVGELHGILADLNMLPDVVHGDAPFDGIMAAIRERIDQRPKR